MLRLGRGREGGREGERDGEGEERGKETEFIKNQLPSALPLLQLKLLEFINAHRIDISFATIDRANVWIRTAFDKADASTTYPSKRRMSWMDCWRSARLAAV